MRWSCIKVLRVTPFTRLAHGTSRTRRFAARRSQLISIVALHFQFSFEWVRGTCRRERNAIGWIDVSFWRCSVIVFVVRQYRLPLPKGLGTFHLPPCPRVTLAKHSWWLFIHLSMRSWALNGAQENVSQDCQLPIKNTPVPESGVTTKNTDAWYHSNNRNDVSNSLTIIE